MGTIILNAFMLGVLTTVGSLVAFGIWGAWHHLRNEVNKHIVAIGTVALGGFLSSFLIYIIIMILKIILFLWQTA